jgi:hypothetical protein
MGDLNYSFVCALWISFKFLMPKKNNREEEGRNKLFRALIFSLFFHLPQWSFGKSLPLGLWCSTIEKKVTIHSIISQRGIEAGKSSSLLSATHTHTRNNNLSQLCIEHSRINPCNCCCRWGPFGRVQAPAIPLGQKIFRNLYSAPFIFGCACQTLALGLGTLSKEVCLVFWALWLFRWRKVQREHGHRWRLVVLTGRDKIWSFW